MKYKNLMAKALYDNVPESPEELAFRKGDILTVIEQNTGGLEGWWLCSLHGRQGIAPGNRLKLLIGPMFEAQSPATQASPSGPAYQQKAGASQGSAQQQGVYQVPQSKVVTPMRVGQSYSYDQAPRLQQDVYDVPPVRPQGVYDIPPAKQGSPFPGRLGDPRAQGLYDVPPAAQGLYDVPPTAQSLYDVPPTAQGLYDVPPTAQSLYDVPPTTQGIYSVPPCRNNPTPQEGNYDFPQPLKVKPGGIYDVPPAVTVRPSAQSNYDFPPSSEPAPARGASSSHARIYDTPPGQPAPSAAPCGSDVYDVPRGGGDYDVPPPQEPRLLGDVTDGVNRLSFSSTGSARSSMSTSSSASSTPEPRAGAGLGAGLGAGPDPDSALQRLGQLQQAAEAAVSALLALAASPRWRTAQPAAGAGGAAGRSDEAQAALERVRAAVGDLLAFGRAAAAGAQGVAERGLQAKLRRQLQRLEDSQQILLQARRDDLERFVMVSRTVPDDAKQLASAVSASAELLFRRAPASSAGPLPANAGPAHDNELYDGQPEKDRTGPFPVPASLQQEKDNLNHSEKCVKSWMEDYDYVHLQGKEEFERQQKELLEKENIIKQNKIHLEQEQLNQFKQLEQEVIKPVDNDITQWISHQQPAGPAPSSDSAPSQECGERQLCEWDRKLLRFYGEQCEAHFVTLLNAVDAFFGCVGAGQPPRIFVAHGKFVILSAHKLVFIGDTLSRQATSPRLAGHVMNYSNALCELLKTVVGATKTAALHYPNTAALQEMVDRVTDLSHQAQQFKVQLLQLSTC